MKCTFQNQGTQATRLLVRPNTVQTQLMVFNTNGDVSLDAEQCEKLVQLLTGDPPVKPKWSCT